MIFRRRVSHIIPSPRPGIYSQNMQVLIPFEEGGGTAVQDMVGPEMGTYAGTTTWLAGPAGFAVGLDGSSSYVVLNTQVPLPLLGTAVVGFTVATWLWFGSRAESYGMVAAQEGGGSYNWELLINPSNQLAVYLTVGNSDPIGTQTVVANQWNHIVYTFGLIDSRMYLNGTMIGTYGGFGGPAIGTSADTITLGGHSIFGSGRYIQGRQGPFAMWDRQLTAVEIQHLWLEPSVLFNTRDKLIAAGAITVGGIIIPTWDGGMFDMVGGMFG